MPDSDTSAEPRPVDSGAGPSLDHRRWWALAVIAMAQLMIVLDSSVLNIALPSAQADLHLSDSLRGWVITGYTLTYGGLLLLGGRMADFLGRRRTFVVGLAGFAAASAACALSTGQLMLPIARTVQGAFAALLAPAALALLAATFTEKAARGRAFAVYGMVTGMAGAVGMLLGGVLTEAGSWRWCLWINVPIAVLAMLGAVRWIRESRAEGRPRYDVPGALTAVLGVGALTYGVSVAVDVGWGSGTTVTALVVGVVGLAAFVVVESKVSRPMLPLYILADRSRATAYLVMFLVGAAMFAFFLFLSYFMQQVLRYSVLESGLAFLPFCAGMFAGSLFAGRLMARAGNRAVMLTGLLLGTAGMAYLGLLDSGSGFLSVLLPAQVVMGVGLGLAFVPATSAGLAGVAPHDLGVASATTNATRQLGGTLGVAVLNLIAVSVARAHSPAESVSALVSGYTRVFQCSAGVLLAALLLSAVLLRAPAKSVGAQ